MLLIKSRLNITFFIILAQFLFFTTLPAQAGLLSPIYWLAKPKLEKHLYNECVNLVAGGDVYLLSRVKPACKTLSKPIAKCLLKQTVSSGRGLGVITELLGAKFGDDSEIVVKRCFATFFGLPVNTFNSVPLREIVERLKETSSTFESPKRQHYDLDDSHAEELDGGNNGFYLHLNDDQNSIIP